MVRNRKKNMRILHLAIMTTAMVVAVQARAALYSITFDSGSGYTAVGTVNVVNGSAINGSITVVGWGLYPGTYSLLPAVLSELGTSGIFVDYTPGFEKYDNQALYQGSSGFMYDNSVNPGITRFGLVFSEGGYDGPEINLRNDDERPQYILQGWTHVGGLAGISGTVTISAVPEPSTYLAGLSALGMLGLFGWRNRK
jgi:hypothetical protein